MFNKNSFSVIDVIAIATKIPSLIEEAKELIASMTEDFELIAPGTKEDVYKAISTIKDIIVTTGSQFLNVVSYISYEVANQNAAIEKIAKVVGVDISEFKLSYTGGRQDAMTRYKEQHKKLVDLLKELQEMSKGDSEAFENLNKVINESKEIVEKRVAEMHTLFSNGVMEGVDSKCSNELINLFKELLTLMWKFKNVLDKLKAKDPASFIA